MENQPPTGSASSWLNRRSPSPSATDHEIARLKERLGFYENFDQIIQENISRASELLKNAVTVRETAEQEIATAREEVERSRVSERSNYRSLLSELLDEVTNMQVQVERLARKVSDALDEVEAALPAPDLDRLPFSSPGLMSLGARSTGAESEVVEAADTDAAQLSVAASDAPKATSLESEDATGEAVVPDESPAATSAGVPDADVLTAEDGPAPEPAVLPAADVQEAAESTSVGELASQDASDAEPIGQIASVAVGEAEVIPVDFVAEQEAPAAELAETASAADADSDLPDTGTIAIQAIAAMDGAAGEVDDVPVETPTPPFTPELAVQPEPEALPDADHAPAEQEAVAAEALPAADAVAEVAELVAPAVESAAQSSASDVATAESDTVREFPAVTTPPPAFRRTGTGELRFPNPLPPVARPASAPTPFAPRGASTTVLVHGVPRATTALSLKRYLESLSHVGAVEPREYAEGVLRLQVIGQRPLHIDDLRGWQDGAGLETVHLRDDLVEVRLPH